MTITLPLVLMASAALSADAEAEFIERVEQTELIVNGKPNQRVYRDDDGQVTVLRLDRMELSEEDFQTLRHITSLKRLWMWGVNVTDDDLQCLQVLPDLEAVSLTNTEVTDAAIDRLLEFPALHTLCLGNVRITPEAIERLQDGFKSHDRRLALGYYQRKE